MQAFSSIRLTFNCTDCEVLTLLTGPSVDDVYNTEERWYNVLLVMVPLTVVN